ncbi:MAG: ABC transporter permease subunit [Candidatus Omnitrophota bacterium]
MRAIAILAAQSFKELIRKKDFYVFLILLVALLIFFFNKSFFGVEDASRYIKDAGYTLIILFCLIITISFAAKQIPSEIESRTIYPLLAKPVSRTEFVVGKYAGSLLVGFFAFTVFFAVYVAAIQRIGEFADPVLIIEAYICSLYLLAFMAAISLFLSLFVTLSANITLTFLLYFAISAYNNQLRDMLTEVPEKASFLYNAIYFLMPHFEFYDLKTRLVHMWDPLPLWVFLSITAYTLIYVGILIYITCLMFRKRCL